MSPDPFRSLDGIDPPEHWDEIAARAASDDVVIELDDVRPTRTRRRAGALVAAAAAVALVAGVAVAQVGDPTDEGVTASDPTTTEAPDPGCPFHLDPAAGYPQLTPGVPTIEGADAEMTGLPALLTTTAHAVIDGRMTIVSVGSDPTSTIRTEGHATAVLPDGSTRHWLHTGGDLTATAGPAVAGCEDADVFVDISDQTEIIDRYELTDEEEAAGETLPAEDWTQEVRDGELTPIDAAARRIYDSVRLTTPEGDDCSVTAPRPATADDVAGTTFGGDLGDGRAFQIRFDDEGLPEVWIDGEQVSSADVTPDGPVISVGDGWMVTDEETGRGLAYGVRPPGTVRTYAVTHDGIEVCAGIVYPDDDRWFALPDVLRRWEILHETADGDIVDGLSSTEPEVETGTEPEPEPEVDVETSDVMAWEGPVGDGRTYRVELDANDTRVLIDGIEIGVARDATPSWTDPMRSFGLNFSEDDVITDRSVVVGAVPPGAVESVVLDEAGQPVVTPSLTFSPDGRFYAIRFEDTVGPTPGIPRPVRHRAADGTLFPVVPDHNAARGIPDN